MSYDADQIADQLADLRDHFEPRRPSDPNPVLEETPRPFTPRKEARTQWSLDRVHAWDVEAANWTDAVAIGLCSPDGSYQEYHTDGGGVAIEGFVDEVMRPKYRNHRFVAHNGANYDFGFLLDEFDRRDVEYSLLLNGQDAPIQIEIWDDDGKPRYFQDSLALLPRSLNVLAEAFVPEMVNIEETDYDAIEPGWSLMSEAFRADLSAYLENDCRVLLGVLEEFTAVIRDLSGGQVGPQLTIGSTTLAMYQVAFMADDAVDMVSSSYRPNSPTNPEEAFREAYYGGRTEVFRARAPKTDGPFYHYDVNSLFPHCYTNYDLPAERPSYQADPNPELIEPGAWDDYGGVVHITGRVPRDTKYPVLPARVEGEGGAEKVLFPTGSLQGEFEGWYYLREVRYAREVGALVDVDVKEAVIARNVPIFTEYGEHLYDLKSSIDSDENPGKYNVVKFLLNAFYGKFGMDRDQTNVHRKANIRDLLADEDATYTAVGRTPEEQDMNLDRGLIGEEETATSSYILPRISGAITAQARIEMHRYFRLIEEQLGGKIYYCDTDSVVTDVELPAEYVGEELGEMDLEGVVEEGVFLRPKTYAESYVDGSNPTLKGKGMSRLDEEVELSGGTDDAVTFEDFIRAWDEDDPSLINASWDGVSGVLSSLKSGNGSMQKEEWSRSLTGFDDKRDHYPDGSDSDPVNLDDFRHVDDLREAKEARGRRRREYHEQARWDTTHGDEPLESDDQLDASLSAAENKENLRRLRMDEAYDRVR